MKRYQLLICVIWILITGSSYCQEKMEVEGAIIIQGSMDPNPAPGTIRYNSSTGNFEGYNGQWMSFNNTSGPSGSDMVTDVDGNRYLAVRIGTQIWMRENLKSSHYNNGTPIPEKTLNSSWNDFLLPGWCWYNNEPANDETYGKLYNWYALSPSANGNRNVCPMGWHIPSDSEWTTLVTFLDASMAGGRMKSTGTIEDGTGIWNAPNIGATNESGFTGFPAGNRKPDDGLFLSMGDLGIFWSSSEMNLTQASARYLGFHINSLLGGDDYDKRAGFSVRCVKD